MTYKQAMAIAKRLGAWREGETLRFPSVWAAQEFERLVYGE